MRPDRNAFARRVRTGDRMLGMMSFTLNEVIVEGMASAGLDFVFLDTEHCPTSLETVARLTRTCDAAGITPFVRFAEVNLAQIQVVLDLGVAGICISNVDSPEEVDKLVQATRFQPSGQRGVCPMARSGQFAFGSWREEMKAQDESIIKIALVESAKGLDAVEEIAAVDGLDMIFLGPGDLSVSLGVPYEDFRHPVMGAALDRVLAASAAGGTQVMTSVAHRMDHAYAAELLAKGVQSISYSTDNMIFYAACLEIGKLKLAPAIAS